MKKCPSCGKENEDINRVCFNCGTELSFQNQVLYEIYKKVCTLSNDVNAIKGWVTFLGILALIGLIFGLIGSCNVLTNLL